MNQFRTFRFTGPRQEGDTRSSWIFLRFANGEIGESLLFLFLTGDVLLNCLLLGSYSEIQERKVSWSIFTFCSFWPTSKNHCVYRHLLSIYLSENKGLSSFDGLSCAFFHFHSINDFQASIFLFQTLNSLIIV